jgi:putative SOS response-associated peptidase YedK
MCGRYKRRSDKLRIAETFAVSAGLDETFFEPGEDFSPQSMQPVIHVNDDGERQIKMMRWAFKLPIGRGRSSTRVPKELNTQSFGKMLSSKAARLSI